jgi:lysozyme family protein
MKHPFEVLRPEYSQLLAAMRVRPECKKLVDEVAVKLVGYKTRYQAVTDADGVPVVFIGPSNEREDNSDFTKNPAQGWPLHAVSKWIPHNGPFPDWKTAAIAAYRLNGLDRIGAANWTWELICFYGEMFNGFGYRDFHRMHSPYLWGGTNIQMVGKYTSDGEFDAGHMDTQLGIIPIARRMVELDPSLALPDAPYVPAPPIASGIAAEPDADAKWVQQTLNALGFDPPVKATGNYDRSTKLAVERFQDSWGLADVDGLVGDKTTAALRKALENHQAAEKPK